MEYYSATKKNEIFPFAKTRMHVEGIMLSEISHSEKENTVCYPLYVESKKYNKVENVAKKKQAHRCREHLWLPIGEN